MEVCLLGTLVGITVTDLPFFANDGQQLLHRHPSKRSLDCDTMRLLEKSIDHHGFVHDHHHDACAVEVPQPALVGLPPGSHYMLEGATIVECFCNVAKRSGPPEGTSWKDTTFPRVNILTFDNSIVDPLDTLD